MHSLCGLRRFVVEFYIMQRLGLVVVASKQYTLPSICLESCIYGTEIWRSCIATSPGIYPPPPPPPPIVFRLGRADALYTDGVIPIPLPSLYVYILTVIQFYPIAKE